MIRVQPGYCANPEKAARLFAKNEAEAMERYDYLSKLTDLYKVEE